MLSAVRVPRHHQQLGPVYTKEIQSEIVCAVDLAQDEALVGTEEVAAWTPFAGVREGVVLCADCVGLFG